MATAGLQPAEAWKDIPMVTGSAAGGASAASSEAPAGAAATVPGTGMSPQDFDVLATSQEAQESGGKQSAVSIKGAAGVMQLKDDAVTDAAHSLGQQPDYALYKQNSPEGTAYNRQMGREYMRLMLTRFGGDPQIAAAAYNAGPTAVQKEINKGGKWPEILARLPAETQAYVKAVVRKK